MSHDKKLDAGLLLQRIEQGGFSGHFLADAFINTYRISRPFGHSLYNLTRLDSEAFTLFLQIIHMRRIPGWSDDVLFSIEQRIINIMEGK